MISGGCSNNHGILRTVAGPSDGNDRNKPGRSYDGIRSSNDSRKVTRNASKPGNIPSAMKNAILYMQDDK